MSFICRLDESLCSKLTLAAMLLCLDFKSDEMTERIYFPLLGCQVAFSLDEMTSKCILTSTY